jgi:RHS repeat-associated protein
LGSTVLLTDSDGNILWQNDVTPFGEETGESGFVHRDGFYTGKKIDRDTGLYYFNARWYDPELGRFITEDPVKDGVNWFGYANQNPLRYIDPTGLMAIRSYQDYPYVMQGWNRTGKNGEVQDVTFGLSLLPLSKYGCAITAMAKAVSNITGRQVTPAYIASNNEYFRDAPGEGEEIGKLTDKIHWKKVAEDNGLSARKYDATDYTSDEFSKIIDAADADAGLVAFIVELKFGDESHFINGIDTVEEDNEKYLKIDPTSDNDIANGYKRSSWKKRKDGSLLVPISEVKSVVEVSGPDEEKPDPYRNGINDIPSNKKKESTDSRSYY